MGRTAIYLHTVVRPGGTIELAAPPGMREGEELGVVLLTEGALGTSPRRSLLEILDSLPPDMAHFKSAHEVDAYVREERESWDH